MNVDEQQIFTLSRDLWAAQLGLNIDQVQAGQSPSSEDEEKVWSSCVKVSGGWQGAILLECPESIIRHASVMLFSSDGDSDDDMQDAAKELADMIGKRIQQLLPETSKLSRPSIVIDREQSKALEGLRDLSNFEFHCEGRPVRIVLFEGEPNMAAAG